MKKERIWELDALRGFAVLCVVVIHFLFDLVYFLGLPIVFSPVYTFIQQYGGVIFVLISGISITLGSKSLLRGSIVFSCGMLITLITWVMARLGLADSSIVVRFGVLHLLGMCMLLYPVYRKASTQTLLTVGICFVILGYVFTTVRVEANWLFPLGLIRADFTSGDYFPLLPHLGWYMLGCALGRILYGEKKTLFPNFPKDFFLVRFFCLCGRHSLWIYLTHQPVVYGLIQLFSLL